MAFPPDPLRIWLPEAETIRVQLDAEGRIKASSWMDMRYRTTQKRVGFKRAEQPEDVDVDCNAFPDSD